ncbi:hypothetical protein F4680DRAFT_456630 [Xylaria scruposa]|nr:hypothetical protein F4680DRAFT_456630 [Xylaria scruposa]
MAPQSPPSSTPVFDSRTQIIDNCEFIISKDDIVQVIISRDPVDKLFKAHAVKCNEDNREHILVSEPCENAQKAIESLQAKSCEAVHDYITTHGFLAPMDSKLASLEPIFDDDDDDAASIISGHSDSSTAALSEWGSSGDEAMLLHEGSGPDKAPKDRQQHPAGWEEPPRTRAVRPTQSRSPSFAFKQAPPPPPVYPAPPKSDGPPAPPPLMRGMAGPPPLPHLYPARIRPGPHYPLHPQNGMKPPMPPAQPLTCFRLPGLPADRPPFPASQGPLPPNINVSNSGGIKRSEHSYNRPRPGAVFQPNVGMYTVGIMVQWIGHGQHRIISSVHPTFQALQNLAIADVRMHPERFTSEGPNVKGFAVSGNRDGDRSGLVAHVSKAVVAGEQYDMQGFHNPNLATLLDVLAVDGMPSFEVVVNDVPPNDDEASG